MDASIKNMPIIDWELGAKLAGNHIDFAKEIMHILIKSLPGDYAAIKQFAALNNRTELLNQIHKLHGAVSYCGAARLKYALATFESALRMNLNSDISDLMNQLDTEIDGLLQECEK